MNISAINSVNCTPIKPKVSFGREHDDSDYQKVIAATSDINDTLVNGTQIKKPLAAAASVALAGVVAFVSGKKIANVISSVVKKAPEALEGGLRKGANAIKGTAEKLASADAEKTILKGKVNVGKLENTIGEAIKKAEGSARNLYTKVAYSGLPEDATSAQKAQKAMENLFGWGAVATVVPSVCSKDANSDGVSDILQKGQNAYTGAQTRFAGAIDSANKLADFIDLLS